MASTFGSSIPRLSVSFVVAATFGTRFEVAVGAKVSHDSRLPWESSTECSNRRVSVLQ